MSDVAMRFPDSALTAKRDEIDRELEVSAGKLPDDLVGHLFVTAPVGTVDSGGLPDPTPSHFLNGDGMVYRFSFEAGRARVRTRLSKTPCYRVDELAHAEAQYEELRFESRGVARASWRLGGRNFVNTAMMVMQRSSDPLPRLFLTYDAGRPYEIDTETCEIVTPVGAFTEWRPEALSGLVFSPQFSSAHPCFDGHTGETFLVNYGRDVGNMLATLPAAEALETIGEAAEDALQKVLSAIDPRLGWRAERLRRALGRAREYADKLVDVEATPDDFAYLLRWDGEGAIERWRLVTDEGPVKVTQSLHQVGVTRRYVVLADTAFKVGFDALYDRLTEHDDEIDRAMRSAVTRPQAPFTRFFFVPRAALVAGQRPAKGDVREVEVEVREATVPRETVHFLVDHDDDGDLVTIHLVHSCATDSSEWLRAFDTSLYTGRPISPRVLGMFAMGEMDLSVLGRYVVNARTGSVVRAQTTTDDVGSWGTTFYAARDVASSAAAPGRITDVYWNSGGFWPELMSQFIYDLYDDYPHRLEPLSRIKGMATEGGVPSSLFRVHTPTMTIADRYVVERGTIVGSPHFVPRPGGEGSTDGYVVTTAFTPSRCELWVFDAARLAQGPVARLHHPDLVFGMTLHSAWLPTIGRRKASYQVRVRDDFDERARKNSLVHELFERAVYPRFA